jgi:hypothetical protein
MEAAMATKTNFTAEEWGRLLSSPMVVGIAITAADPSGVWGLLKESMSGGWAILEARQDGQANALVKDVAQEFTTPEGRTAARAALQARFTDVKMGALKDTAITELRAISGILDLKSPKDAATFKTWLQQVAQKAAEAGTEGGFLGFGGVAVSQAEKATLSEISAALGHSGTTAT